MNDMNPASPAAQPPTSVPQFQQVRSQPVRSQQTKLSIIVMLLFCFPLGAIAFVCARQANRKLKAGDIVGGKEYALVAKTLNIIGIVLGTLVTALVVSAKIYGLL